MDVWWWIGSVLLALFIGVMVSRAMQRRAFARAFPYHMAEALFTPAERAFLSVLDKAVGPRYRVFGKVRIADIAAVSETFTSSVRQVAFNKISAKHVDFVVCRASDLKMVCAVELNDKSHDTERAQQRDKFVATVFEVIDLPLLMVPARRRYSQRELRREFMAAVGDSDPSANVSPRE